MIKEAQNLPGEYVLFQLPVADRFAEANAVLTTIGRFPLLIDGVSGFEPAYYRHLVSEEVTGKWEFKDIFPWVTQIWPEAYLLIDS